MRCSRRTALEAVGIAVSGVTGTANGTWEYLHANGAWTPLPTIAAKAALLLAAQDMLAFVPRPGFAGVVTLEVHAWDGTQGTAGTTFDLSKHGSTGGATAFRQPC